MGYKIFFAPKLILVGYVLPKFAKLFLKNMEHGTSTKLENDDRKWYKIVVHNYDVVFNPNYKIGEP